MYIKVHALPDTKSERVRQVSKDTFEISVREKPERNRANNRILQILKEHLGITRIRLVSGHHSPSKIFDISHPDQ